MRFFKWMQFLAALIVFGAASWVAADDSMVVGSARFAPSMDVRVANKPVKVMLTGAAMRKKAFFSVYAVASYLQAGVPVKSAEQLAAADGVKLLFLVMERDISGRDMADAIQAGVRLNYPADAFAAELRKVASVLGAMDLRRGDHVILTSLPGVGLRFQIVGRTDATIESPAFARAVWDIYLGRNNLSDSVKSSLASRL